MKCEKQKQTNQRLGNNKQWCRTKFLRRGLSRLWNKEPRVKNLRHEWCGYDKYIIQIIRTILWWKWAMKEHWTVCHVHITTTGRSYLCYRLTIILTKTWYTFYTELNLLIIFLDSGEIVSEKKGGSAPLFAWGRESQPLSISLFYTTDDKKVNGYF